MCLLFTGISYLPPGEEQRLREQLLLRQEQAQQRAQSQVKEGALQYSPNFASPNMETFNPIKGPIPVPEEHVAFINNIWSVASHVFYQHLLFLMLYPIHCGGFFAEYSSFFW